MSKSLFTCIFFAFYANLAGAALPSELDSLLDDYPVPRGRIGLYIAPAGGGQAVSLNPSRPFNPASTIKLLPSLAALEILSPAYQWHTRVYTTGEISGGVLNGDLYMLGGGDPYLTAEALWALLKDVRAQGIERIAGDIIVDNGVYRPVDFDRAAFDDKPDRLYNGPADGLMINFWGVRFTVRANAERIHIDAFPGSRQLEVVNRVRHSEAPCSRAHRRVRYRVESSPERVAVVFSGVLSRRCRPVVINRAVIPVDRYAGYVLPGLWHDAGGVLDGSVRNGRVPEEAELLVSRPSRSLAEVVRATNKFSNNMMARHLLLTLGSVRKERGIALADGLAALNAWQAARGLDLPGLRISNGSGLSRDTRISALGMAGILRAGLESRYAPEFLASLPVAGEDRALDSRTFQGSDAIVRIKTGLIDHVRAMAGYVTTRRGETWIVVMLINHEGIHQGLGTRMQDAVIRHVLAR